MIVLVVALVGLAGAPRRLWLDRAILVALGALSVAVVTGVLAWLTGRPVRDPLHVVYAAAALLTLPVARYLGRADAGRRRHALVAVAGLVLLGLWFRLLQTGMDGP